MSEYPINTMVIALDHLEAYIAGSDEAGDVSEEDAMAALDLLRTRTKGMERALKQLASTVEADLKCKSKEERALNKRLLLKALSDANQNLDWEAQ